MKDSGDTLTATRRATRRVTAEALCAVLSLPSDAQIIGADFDGRTNTVEIHYTSKAAKTTPEASVSMWDT